MQSKEIKLVETITLEAMLKYEQQNIKKRESIRKFKDNIHMKMEKIESQKQQKAKELRSLSESLSKKNIFETDQDVMHRRQKLSDLQTRNLAMRNQIEEQKRKNTQKQQEKEKEYQQHIKQLTLQKEEEFVVTHVNCKNEIKQQLESGVAETRRQHMKRIESIHNQGINQLLKTHPVKGPMFHDIKRTE